MVNTNHLLSSLAIIIIMYNIQCIMYTHYVATPRVNIVGARMRSRPCKIIRMLKLNLILKLPASHVYVRVRVYVRVWCERGERRSIEQLSEVATVTTQVLGTNTKLLCSWQWQKMARVCQQGLLRLMRRKVICQKMKLRSLQRNPISV